MAAREQTRQKFPRWAVTNWGSDIYLFGRLAEHRHLIEKVLTACDYYSCECQRDVFLAKQLGLRGKVLTVLPNTGGFDLNHVAKLRSAQNPSSRKLIVLKGYQNWAGRALVGLRAIELCAHVLQGYKVAVYSAPYDVEVAVELASQATGIPMEIVPPCSHDDMLRLLGAARVYLGLSISDAISTSLLEAMVMGAFPIQSGTACADEWIEDGKTGFIVQPDDPEAIGRAITRAVSDDDLVDYAAQENYRVAVERLDVNVIQPKVVAMYDDIAKELGLMR